MLKLESIVPPAKIRAPGAYRMSAMDYHSDPCPDVSLSSSIAKKLIAESPLHAWTAHPRLNPQFERQTKPKFDFGSMAHKLVLGAGAEIDVLEYDSYRTNDAKRDRDLSLGDGRIPALEKDYDRACLMQQAFWNQLQSSDISKCFSHGESEIVLVWREHGLWCRSMLDKVWIAKTSAVICDYKSTEASAAPSEVSRRIFQMDYDLQAVFYMRGLLTLFPALTDVQYFIVTQEVQPPFGLSISSISLEAAALAQKKIWAALALWERSISTGKWPGYPAEASVAHYPPWHEQQWIDREIHDVALQGLDYSRFAPAVKPEPKTLVIE